MPDDPRVQRLLDELLESGGTPEQLCAGSPDLLPRVRSRWRQIRRLSFDLDNYFPACNERPLKEPELPHVPGYRVERVLGTGGMGIVFAARHLRLNRPVALKMILAGPFARPAERERFVREAEAVAALRHPNVVQVYDAGEANGRPYFTMELVEGGQLSQKTAGAPQPASHAAALVEAVAHAVHAAHEHGIVHRDLKPSNILLSADGTPKVMDFGLAHRLEGGDGSVGGALTISGVPVGTPSYMAPEQARGASRQIGPATDVYALGAILYELLTGRPPFRADTAAATLQQVVTDEPVSPARMNPRIPRDLDTVCLKCLCKEPQGRYPSAAGVAEDLRRFRSGEPIMARPLGRLGRLARWARRRPTSAALAASLFAAILLAVTLAGGGLWLHGQRRATDRAADIDLRDANQYVRSADAERAHVALERARGRLGVDGAPHLRRRLETLEQCLALMERLETLRLEGTYMARGRHEAQLDREYEDVFRSAGLGAPGDDPEAAARGIKASPAHAALVGALDAWTVRTNDEPRRDWLLRVARLSDPDPNDPWRAQARDPTVWKDKPRLLELARAVEPHKQPLPLLLAFGRRLAWEGLSATEFLRRVHEEYPGDFYASMEFGVALADAGDGQNAITVLHMARAVHPDAGAVHCNLARALLRVGRVDEAFAFAEHGHHLNAPPKFQLSLGREFQQHGYLDRAIQCYDDAVRTDPGFGVAQGYLCIALVWQGHPEKARAAWLKMVEPGPLPHDAWFGYAELCAYRGYEDEYRRARRDLLQSYGGSSDSFVAQRTAQACLLLPGTKEELDAAVALADRAARADRTGREWASGCFDFTNGLADYRLGRFDEAIEAMHGKTDDAGPAPSLVTAMALHQKGQADQALKLMVEGILSWNWGRDEFYNETWIAHVLRREAESLMLPNLPAFLKGEYQPRGQGERLAMLGACRANDLRATQAGLYAAAFAHDPKLSDALPDPSRSLFVLLSPRHEAACAAAVAGCGGGADGPKLGEDERAHWRRQAREWLRLDLDAWAQKLPTLTPEAREKVMRFLAGWQQDVDFAGLRDPPELEKLPPSEREECRTLWKQLEVTLVKARTS